MGTLDNLVSTPVRFGIRSTYLFQIQGGVYLAQSYNGNSTLSSRASELIHVTKGTINVELSDGTNYSVSAGESSFLPIRGLYVLQDGSEVISIRQAEHPGEDRVYVPGGHTDARRAITDITSTVKHFRVADQPNVELGHH